MSENISPLERSMQILRQIELEEQGRKAPADVEEKVASTPSSDGEKQSGSDVSETASSHPLLKFDRSSLLQGVVFSEILGKPVSRRRGRW